MIELNITKAKMNATSYETLTSGMANAVSVHFTFSSDWDNLSKTAVFSNGAETVTLLESEWSGADTCVVPFEVLQKPFRTVNVGLVGTSGDTVILPTVWCSIGRVWLGANAEGDPSTDPTLPVWAQLQSEIAELGPAPYTTLEKNPRDTVGMVYPVRVFLHGLSPEDAGAKIHVYYAIRNRQRRTYWRHPDNYTVGGENSSRFGYGQIAGAEYGGNEQYSYDAVPPWMPNDGYLESEFTLTKTVIERGYYDVDLSTWLLPLVKPKTWGANGLVTWNTIGLMGLSQYGMNGPLLFRFRIAKNGFAIGESHDTLAIGLRGSLNTTSNWQTTSGTIRTGHMYASIR